MSLLWLSALPLAGAAITALLQRWRRPATLAGLATIAGCLVLCRSLPSESAVVLLQQDWMLTASTRMLLTYLYATTAILLAIGCFGQQNGTVAPAMLASIGVLSAALLLRSTWLSLIVLAAAMLLPAIGSFPASPSSIRGATRYLIWVTLPIPFLLAIPPLLEQVSVHPQEMEWYGRCAWLLVPALLFWLNLFPIDAAMSLWANDAAPLMPAYVWLVQQVAALHMLMSFWQANPLLWTLPVAQLARVSALLTTLLAGVVATIQLSPPAVLGSAAMATLGLAMLGVVNGPEQGPLTSGMILAGRSVAVLLGCVALEVAYRTPEGVARPPRVSSRLATLVPMAVVWLAIAGVVVLPSVPLPQSNATVLSVLSVVEPLLPRLWKISMIGVLIGIGRTSWSLWRSRLSRSSRHDSSLTVLLIGSLLVFLYLLFNPEALARIASYVLPV